MHRAAPLKRNALPEPALVNHVPPPPAAPQAYPSRHDYDLAIAEFDSLWNSGQSRAQAATMQRLLAVIEQFEAHTALVQTRLTTD